MDSWFSMNWQTGEKEPIFSFDQPDITCPATLSPDEMFIGKAGITFKILRLFKVVLINNCIWNVRFNTIFNKCLYFTIK